MPNNVFSSKLTRELYDQFSLEHPRLSERWRVESLIANSLLSNFGIKAAAIHRLVREYPDYVASLRRRAQAFERNEPRGYSPLAQFPGLVLELNPRGELTGGNFGS